MELSLNEMQYDTYNDCNVNPDIIFEGLKFKLKKFDFDKDLIFKNMTQVKLKEDEESFLLMTSYEFNYDNTLEKLKELFPNGEVLISSTMFIQLYLYLIKQKSGQRFIFKRELFESFDRPQSFNYKLPYIDRHTHMLYVLYIDNYHMNDLLKDIKCFYNHIFLIKTGKDNHGYEIYSGLLLEGIKTMTVLNWAKYLKSSCKEFFIEKKIKNDIEYESESRDLIELNKKELDEHMKIYSNKKKIQTLNNYYDVGYFDIWEFSNSLTTIAINTETNKLVNIN